MRRSWVLGLIGGALIVPSLILGVILLSVGADVLPFADDALDASHAVAEGRIEAVEYTGFHWGGDHAVRVSYRFSTGDGSEIEGHSFTLPYRGLAPGEPARIEYLPESPDVNRLRGSHRTPLGVVSTIMLGVLVFPAVLILLWWLRGVMRLRLLLSTGRATTAEIVSRREVWGVNPPQERVTYRFRDVVNRPHEDDHWVGRRSPLGRHLGGGADTAAVIHDEGDPNVSRLVHPTDFRA